MQRTPATRDRWLAALAQFGVPLYSVILPLVIWGVSASRPFPRAHARRAFSFQCVFLGVWIVLVGLMLLGVIGPFVLVGVLVLGVVIELPWALLALAGRPPTGPIPIDLLAQ